MEIEGISAWVLRNFYDKEDVIKKVSGKKASHLQELRLHILAAGC